MRSSRVTEAVLAGFLLIAAAPSFAATLVNTYPGWNGTSFISSFGVPNTETYGQLITVPTGEVNITARPSRRRT